MICFCRNSLNVQIFLKMHRSDYAERQLRVMQQIDEDHTLTQLANAWLNLSVVHMLSIFSQELKTVICNLISSFESGWFQDTGSISHLPRFLREVSDDKFNPKWEGCLLYAHGKL